MRVPSLLVAVMAVPTIVGAPVAAQPAPTTKPPAVSQVDSDRARDLNNTAAALTNAGSPAQALVLYGRAIALNPYAAVFYNNRGAARDRTGDLAGALADYDTALRIDPKPAVYYNNRAAVLVKKSDVDNALADYDRAVRAEPKVGFFHQERAKARLNKGDIAGALAEFREAFRLDPKLTSARDQAEALASVPATPKPQQMPANSPVPGRRVALVIGNGLYDRITTLDNPRRDAALVADELRKVGFSSVEVVNDAKMETMNAALDRFGAEASKADWAVIYYSGHGVAAGKTSYLLPVDIKRVQEDVDLQNVAIPLDRLLSAIQRAKKMRLVILDACRDDPFAGALKRTISTRSVNRGLAPPRLGPDAGLLVAYSAQPGAVASDGIAGQNSPYTAALARRMDTPGLEIARVFRLVYDDVAQATENKQKPAIEGQFGGDDLFFRPAATSGSPAPR